MQKKIVSLVLAFGLLGMLAGCGQTNTAHSATVQTMTPSPAVTTAAPTPTKTPTPQITEKKTPTPKATQTPKTTKAAKSKADNAATVYITDTGGKYHRSGCRYLKKSKHAISLSDAKAQGYTPCKVCKP